VKVLAWYDNEWGYSVQMLNAAEALMAAWALKVNKSKQK
jgi:glyceraldehyde 3-phosphate dehydrogenase